MEQYVNDYGKTCWRRIADKDILSLHLFSFVEDGYEDDFQVAFHSNLGSITVVDRMTGYGWRDTETGYRDLDGKLWIASGMFDIRDKIDGCFTVGGAIASIKKNANTCVGG